MCCLRADGKVHAFFIATTTNFTTNHLNGDNGVLAYGIVYSENKMALVVHWSFPSRMQAVRTGAEDGSFYHGTVRPELFLLPSERAEVRA